MPVNCEASLCPAVDFVINLTWNHAFSV
jgi:hypothetical protein